MKREKTREPAPVADAVRPRLFSVSDANRALVLVRPILQAFVDAYATLNSQRDADTPDAARLEALIDRLRDLEQELRDIGCELKDPVVGLIDFPARHEGRTVYLCWKLGESAIEHWHELDAGFTGRRPIGPDFGSSDAGQESLADPR
jgi:hypothetical protein